MKTVDIQSKSSAYDTDLLRRCRDVVWEVAPSATVILYGSRARRDAASESDYDLLLLVEEPLTRGLEDRIGDSLYSLELEFGQI